MDRESCGRWVQVPRRTLELSRAMVLVAGLGGADKSWVKFWYRDKGRTLVYLGVVSTASTTIYTCLVLPTFLIFF
jgi:hypothetical protein